MTNKPEVFIATKPDGSVGTFVQYSHNDFTLSLETGAGRRHVILTDPIPAKVVPESADVREDGDVLIRAGEFQAFALRVHAERLSLFFTSPAVLQALTNLAREQSAPAEPEVPEMPGYEWRGVTEDVSEPGVGRWYRDGDLMRDQFGRGVEWPTLWKAGVRQVNP